MMNDIRHNWTTQEILDIYNKPLLELVFEAATMHRKYHDPQEVQVSSLISIKTGGCPEDCAYCPQAARYHTNVKVHKLMPVNEVVEMAKNAKTNGASRVCLGAAWRNVRDNSDFDKVCEMVKEITTMDMEVCCTLGMLTEQQAEKLANAGLYAYNHNIDTSEEHYGDIISTRTYDDRLKTLENVRKAKLTVCSGGIIGMGESVMDRVNMLRTLANLPEHPHSTPINVLVFLFGKRLTRFQSQEVEHFHVVIKGRIGGGQQFISGKNATGTCHETKGLSFYGHSRASGRKAYHGPG